ncbi:MAG: hypothetical protein WDN30_08800 [Pararobbsia sp.]
MNARAARLRARRGSRRLKVAPIKVHSSDGSADTAHPVGGGELFLTNQRLVFMSAARSTNILFADVIGIRGTAETLAVHTARRRRPYHFTVQNPVLWALLAKMVSSHTPQSPLLPDGMRLRAAPTGIPARSTSKLPARAAGSRWRSRRAERRGGSRCASRYVPWRRCRAM